MAPGRFSSRLLVLSACGGLSIGLAACNNSGAPKDADLVSGKKAFAAKCGSCHVLAHAGTKGTQGPNLDAAFARSLRDGFGRDTIRGAVHSQINHPAALHPGSSFVMPAKLVTGKVAENVAAYVATVAAVPGKDQGLLATAVPLAGAGKPVAAAGGKLEMPTDPGGQLAYVTKVATAPAGKLTIEAKNAASIPHNIAIEGNGVSEQGKVVQGGGVSTISATLKPGKYQYFCTVPGHRAGGMEGTLTVK